MSFWLIFIEPFLTIPPTLIAFPNGISSLCFISVGDEKYRIFLFKDLRIKKIATIDKEKIKNKNSILVLTFFVSIKNAFSLP
jgi:hypothetical protein